MQAIKDEFLKSLGLTEYWKEHTNIRYAKYQTVYSKTNTATKTIYGVFINEGEDEMLLFTALYSNNYEVQAKDVKGHATNEEVAVHIAKYREQNDIY